MRVYTATRIDVIIALCCRPMGEGITEQWERMEQYPQYEWNK